MSKNIAGVQIRKVILLNYQNNYVERSNQWLEYQNILMNYFSFSTSPFLSYRLL